MATTLADVARRASVSTATASRVLNNKMVMPISPSTIERIRQAARELDYRPNALARALVSRRTHTIGLFSQEMTDPHFAQMLEAVEARARALGYHVVVCGDLEGLAGERRVDGVVMLSFPYERRLFPLSVDTPAVFVWHMSRALPDCVCWSDIEGSYRAGRYLLELGHRRIAALFGNYPTSGPLPAKVEGFRRAMAEAGVPCYEGWQELSGDQIENGYLLTRELLQKSEPVTALFARNDFLAMGALRALREAGLSVPRDVSLVAYNDTILARAADPPLTSVRTPIAEAGAIAVEQLVNAIEDRMPRFAGTLLSTSLTVRQSCAPPRSGRAESLTPTSPLAEGAGVGKSFEGGDPIRTAVVRRT